MAASPVMSHVMLSVVPADCGETQEWTGIHGDRGDERTGVFLESFKNLGLGYIRDFRPSFRDLLSTYE